MDELAVTEADEIVLVHIFRLKLLSFWFGFGYRR